VTRAYVGFTTRGPTVFRNVRKAQSGEILVTLDENEAKDLQLDFTGYLETGETVSSATVEPEGVTATVATTSPNVTLTLSEATKYDLSGKIETIVTFSSGEKWRQLIRVRRRSRYKTDVYDNLTDYT